MLILPLLRVKHVVGNPIKTVFPGAPEGNFSRARNGPYTAVAVRHGNIGGRWGRRATGMRMEIAHHGGAMSASSTVRVNQHPRLNLEMGVRRGMNVLRFPEGVDASCFAKQDAACLEGMRCVGGSAHRFQGLSCNAHVHRAWTYHVR